MKSDPEPFVIRYLFNYGAIMIDNKLLSILESKRAQLNEYLIGFDSENFNVEHNKLLESISRIISLIDPNGQFRQGCISLYSDWMWANKTETSEEPGNCEECQQVLERMLDVLNFVLETGMAKVVKEVSIYTEQREVSDDYDVIDDL